MALQFIKMLKLPSHFSGETVRLFDCFSADVGDRLPVNHLLEKTLITCCGVGFAEVLQENCCDI